MPDHPRNPFAPPSSPVLSAPGYAAARDALSNAGGSTAGTGWRPPPPPAPRSLRGLGRTTAALLAVQAVLGVAGAVVSAVGVLSWSRISSAPVDTVLAADRAQMVLLMARAPLGALTAIAFVAWTWAATANLRDAGARVRHAPGWALGAWLVPVLNLWRPKQMVDDLWRASAPGLPLGVDLRVVRKPGVVALWWVSYLVGSALPAVGVVTSVRAALQPYLQAVMAGTAVAPSVDVARAHETTALFGMWGAVLSVVAAACAVSFVLRISRWQDERLLAA